MSLSSTIPPHNTAAKLLDMKYRYFLLHFYVVFAFLFVVFVFCATNTIIIRDFCFVYEVDLYSLFGFELFIRLYIIYFLNSS